MKELLAEYSPRNIKLDVQVYWIGINDILAETSCDEAVEGVKELVKLSKLDSGVVLILIYLCL